MPRKLEVGPSFDEFAATLTWPRLLRAPGLALRPARLGLSFVLLLAVSLIAQLPTLWLGKAVGPAHMVIDKAQAGMRAVRRALLEADLPALADGLRMIFLDGPLSAAREFPWSSLAILVPLLLVWGILGGAVSRLAAEEHSLGLRKPWTSGLAFALSRWFSLVACMMGPLAALLATCAALAGVGWVMLGLPYVNIAGGALFVIALIVGAGVTVLGGAVLVGSPMLVPGVACEGTDAIDSVQRVLAYMLARPGRVALYLIILILQLVLCVWVLWMVADAVEAVTTSSVTAFMSKEDAGVVISAIDGTESSAELKNHQQLMVRGLSFWSALPDLFVGAFAVSFWFTGGTLLYLATRRICDGQDAEELWTPSMTPGTVPTAEGDGDDGE